MLIRKIATRVAQTIAERRAAVRKKVQVPVVITFEPDRNGAKQTQASDDAVITGVTRDISTCGIGVVVGAIRLSEKYLVGQERVLRVEIQVPGRPIVMKVVGRRYEEIGIHMSTERFLVGAEIVDMSESDRRAYERFVDNAEKYVKKMLVETALQVE
jgi:hypothetical protein